MEVIFFLIFIIWVFRGAFTGGTTPTYANSNALALPELKIKKAKNFEENKMYQLQLKGFFPFYSDNNYNFVISIFDETEGLDNLKPIFSYIPEISETKTLAYQMVIQDVYIPAMGGFENFTDFGRIPVELLSPPKKGKKKLLVLVRVFSTHVEPDIEFGFGGESSVYEISTNFRYEFSEPGYMDKIENQDKIITTSIELALSMAHSDGNLDKSEIKIIKDWIKEKSKKFNPETETFVEDDELIKLFEESFNVATEEIKKGNLSTSIILSTIVEIADEKSKHDVVELCYKVLSADGHMDSQEKNLIKIISDELNIKHGDLQNLKDQSILNLSISENEHSSDSVDDLLGINDGMSRGQKIQKLKDDFNKWNERLNILSNQDEKRNAQDMIDLISKELKKLR